MRYKKMRSLNTILAVKCNSKNDKQTHFSFSLRLDKRGLVRTLCGQLYNLESGSVIQSDIMSLQETLATMRNDKSNACCLECSRCIVNILDDLLEVKKKLGTDLE
jgi:hypothetical protein